MARLTPEQVAEITAVIRDEGLVAFIDDQDAHLSPQSPSYLYELAQDAGEALDRLRDELEGEGVDL